MSVLALLSTASPALAIEPPPAPDQQQQPIDPATDPAFSAALPPLDSVAAPPVTSTTTGAAAPAAAAAVPATTAPVTDPALAQPLPPLAGFDPTPDTSKAKVPTSEDTRIRYSMEVEGLKKIGLEAQFRSLSELENGKKKAANAAQVAARAVDDVQLAERLLRSEGYYDGAASSTVTAVKDKPGEVVATISATPGPRYTVSSIAVTQALPDPTERAMKALTPQFNVGSPIRSVLVEGGEAQISLLLPQQGYPFAKVGQRDILLDGETHTGDYTLPLDAGPKSSFGALQTKGADLFTLKHLAIFPRFKPGQPYDSRKTDDLRQALVATGIFSTVAIQPVDTGKKAADGTEVVDLLVTQEKGPWRAWAGQLGYGTGQGILGTVSWTDRNLFPPEGALIPSLTVGTQEQGANLAYRRSNAGQRDKTFQISGGFDRSDYDAYKAKTFNLSVNWSRQSTPIWQKRWTYTYGAEIIETDEQGAALTATDVRPYRTYEIAALPIEVQYDRSNDLLNPTHGYRLLVRVSPEASIRGGIKGYARLTAQTTAYLPIGKSFVIAGRAMVNSIEGVSNIDEIAPSRRIYAGGGGSVRGFGYQQLGPKDAQNNPIGGLTSTELAVEARYRFGNFGIVPFMDAGRVGANSTPGIGGMRYGAGIGGRYYTNFGPLRLDIATPIHRQPGESKVALYISIGQAF